MPQVSNTLAEFVRGLRAFAPMSMSIIPFGMVCGAAARGAGMSTVQSMAMSWIVFAGSAQIAATQLLASGAPLWVIVATATIINLRFMMYAASLVPYFRSVPRGWQASIAYLLTDQAYAVTVTQFVAGRDHEHLHWYYLGFGAATWVSWQLATCAGIVLGDLVPADWSLDFIVPLTFIAMLVPLLRDRAMIMAAVAGGCASVLLSLPLKLNLIAAAMIGVAVGWLGERFSARPRA